MDSPLDGQAIEKVCAAVRIVQDAVVIAIKNSNTYLTRSIV